MAWTEEEREMLEFIVERGVSKAVSPIRDDVRSLQQTVNGTEKEPGLVGKMDDTRKRLVAVELFKAQALAISGLVATGVTMAINLGKSLFGK
jgi:hypothetical protein